MDIGMLHLHTTSIILFLLFFLFKTILLLLDKLPLLGKIKAKTKWVDMVLGILILATGAYLTAKQEVFQSYLTVKIILVLIAIPLGIVALKKNIKALAIISTLIFLYVYGMAETKSITMQPTKYSTKNVEMQKVAQEIFESECAKCHGISGKALKFGAKDLTLSVLTKEQKINIIKNGKGTMAPYGKRFTDEQIQALSEYVEKLKK